MAECGGVTAEIEVDFHKEVQNQCLYCVEQKQEDHFEGSEDYIDSTSILDHNYQAINWIL